MMSGVRLSLAAPPGSQVRPPQAGPAPSPTRHGDHAEVREVEPEPSLKGAVLAAMASITVLSAFSPTAAAAHPAPARVESRSREDEKETHPAWRLVDGAEDAARSAGDRVREGVDGAREALREAVPQPVRQGVEGAREVVQAVDQWGREGQIGHYRYTWDVIDADFDVNPRLKLRDGKPLVGLELETEAHLFRGRISKVEESPSGWRTEQGLRGGVYLRNELELTTGLEGGSTRGSESTNRAEARAEAFREWRGTWRGDYKVRFEVSPGVAQDLLNSNTLAYTRFEQGIEGGGFEFRGAHYSWAGEAREELRYNVSDGETGYEYRLFGGVSRTFDRQLLGRKVKLEARVGPEIQGNQNDPFNVRPRVKLRVRW